MSCELGALVLVRLGQQGVDRLLQLVEQLDREAGEVVDEVQRVLDLVRDAGGELAERGHLLGLDQVGLGGLQPLQRIAQLGEQPHVLDGDHRLGGKGFQQLDLLRRERSRLWLAQRHGANGCAFAHHGAADRGAEAVWRRESTAAANSTGSSDAMSGKWQRSAVRNGPAWSGFRLSGTART